jgi:hypothetical protein
MNFKTVWMLWLKGANFSGMLLLIGLIGLAIPSAIVRAGGVDFSTPDDDPHVVKNVDPDNNQNLDGTWWCYFLKSKNEIEQNYYSVWIFEAGKGQVTIYYSPVHIGSTYGYRWDGKQLAFGDPSNFSRQIIGTFKTQIHLTGSLVIEDPRLRWKGWYCTNQQGTRWPADELKFLDYSRYPWLSNLTEDRNQIMKYRDPKQYEEWLRGYPR